MGIAALSSGRLNAGPVGFVRPTRSYNIVAASANATNNKAVEDDITARNGSGSVIPDNAGNGEFVSHRKPVNTAGKNSLFVYLAELLFQFEHQTVDALFRYRIVRRFPCKRPVFHDLHFEFHSFVL
jgi:hypothetical protein